MANDTDRQSSVVWTDIMGEESTKTPQKIEDYLAEQEVCFLFPYTGPFSVSRPPSYKPNFKRTDPRGRVRTDMPVYINAARHYDRELL